MLKLYIFRTQNQEPLLPICVTIFMQVLQGHMKEHKKKMETFESLDAAV